MHLEHQKWNLFLIAGIAIIQVLYCAYHFLCVIRQDNKVIYRNLDSKIFAVGGLGAVLLSTRENMTFLMAFFPLCFSVILLIAYANVVAFFKRGITFSLLQNHQLPPDQRQVDSTFIDLAMRFEEMKSQKWVIEKGAQLEITKRGQIVSIVYSLCLKVLGIKPIG